MANDDAYQASDSEERHEAERRTHHIKSKKSAHSSIGHRCKNEQRLDRMVELQDERKEDRRNGDGHDHSQVAESVHLLGILSADQHRVARRKRLLKFHQLQHRRLQDVGSEGTLDRGTFHADGSKMLLTANSLGIER